MNRDTKALLIAPLAVPLVFLPWLVFGHLAFAWVFAAEFIAAVTSYAGMFIIGLPLYHLLQPLGLTRAWVAPVAGSVAGGLMWVVFSVLFALSLDEGSEGMRFALTDASVLRGIFWPGGVLGAVVGTLFWLIARPDKQSL